MILSEVAVLSSCRDVAAPVSPAPDAAIFSGHDRGFIWSADGGLQLIPQPAYAASMVISAINNNGQVVGHLRLQDGRDDYRAFIWSVNDGLQRLGSLVGREGESTALTINDNGEVHGMSDGPSTQDGPEGRMLRDAFVWTAADGMKSTTWTKFGDLKAESEGGKLRLPPGTDCMQVTGASASGLAIGFAGLTEPGTCHETTTLMWELDGAPVVIEQCNSRGGCDMGLADVNDRGEVIGRHDGHGVRWTRSSGFVQVPIPYGSLIAINEHGDVSGAVFDNADFPARPFVWMASGEIRIIPFPNGATSGYALDINDKGQVTGILR
jgi:hypothetical protein